MVCSALQIGQMVELINEHSPLTIKVTPQKIDRDFSSYTVIEEDSVVIALGKLLKLSWYQGEISHVVVRPEHRRTGYGHRIVENVCDNAAALGLKVVQCTIRSSNDVSQRLFSHMDFRPCTAFIGPSGHRLDIWQRVL